uniref:Uncharacterized protein n=1 Tax=Anopheles epiroticus TaxID=199890 RepID=A0A182PQJ2_9DIPT
MMSQPVFFGAASIDLIVYLGASRATRQPSRTLSAVTRSVLPQVRLFRIQVPDTTTVSASLPSTQQQQQQQTPPPNRSN